MIMNTQTNNSTKSENLEEKRFFIVTNKNGRRILMVNNLVQVDNEPAIKSDDFDAIFINIAHRAYEENRLIIRWTSPIRTQKCYLKPLFATTALEEFMHFAAYLIDGFCSSPYDDKFTDFIETVYKNITKYNIRKELSNSLSSTAKNLANMVKFDISRGRLTYTNMTIRGYAKGYSAAFLAWYDNQETLHHDERAKFNLKMVELGFSEKVRMVDRIHTCPDCGESHLLFVECCPKCKSSNIHQEAIIHHFRCANISPESSYQWDGELRCPKCKKLLRHIGVDYDRPAVVYTCFECGNTFMRSNMRVVCTNCGLSTTPDQLVAVDINEYKLTNEGLKAFATDEALLQIESKDIFSGHCTYEDFKNTILSFSDMPSYRNHLLIIMRYEYSYEGVDENLRLMDIMRSILSQLVTFKITTRGHEILFMAVIPKQVAERENERFEKLIDRLFDEYAVRQDGFKVRLLQSYVFDSEENKPAELIKLLEERIDDNVKNPEDLF